jgi:hypothetical protein
MIEWSLFYEYHEGELIRKSSNNQHQHVGSVNSSGYIQFEHFGKTVMLHRAIFELHFGEIPAGMQIDHIDRNPLNNRIENLRLASQNQNQINSRIPKNNTTGFKGVLRTPNGKFQARLGFNGKKLYLDLFDTAEEANECVKNKTLELYGEFAISN